MLVLSHLLLCASLAARQLTPSQQGGWIHPPCITGTAAGAGSGEGFFQIGWELGRLKKVTLYCCTPRKLITGHVKCNTNQQLFKKFHLRFSFT